MADNDSVSGQRDRSPAYPVVPLDVALTRLSEFDAHFKRSAARPERIGEAWGIKAKAYADRIVAALRYFGFLEYKGSEGAAGNGALRYVTVSDEGRKYLRAQQEETRGEIVKAAALRPKQIAKFWAEWGADRPADAAAIDQLALEGGFSDAGARDFLKVYDATIAFAKLGDSDKITEVVDEMADISTETTSMIQSPSPASRSASVSHHALQTMPPFPAGVEMSGAKDQYNVATYSSLEGNRIRVSADLNIAGAKLLVKILENRIKMIEEEERILKETAN